jgi:hypothetical protein
VKPADPFHPLSPGLHRTAEGVAYQTTGPDEHVGDLDFLFGREIDIDLLPFCYRPGTPDMWAAVLVELNFAMPAYDIGPDGKAVVVGDRIGEVLARRGLLPYPGLTSAPPDGDGPARWVVRTLSRGSRPSGVYGPGPRGLPSGWVLGTPLPYPGPTWRPTARARAPLHRARHHAHQGPELHQRRHALRRPGGRGRRRAAVRGPRRRRAVSPALGGRPGWYRVAYSTNAPGHWSIGAIDCHFSLGHPANAEMVAVVGEHIAARLRDGAGVLPAGSGVIVLGWSFLRPGDPGEWAPAPRFAAAGGGWARRVR